MTPEEFSDYLDEKIDSAMSDLMAEASKAQRRILADIIAETSKFTLDASGKIKPTAGNLKQMEKIRMRLENIIGHEKWNEAVEKFSDSFRVTETILKTYMHEIGGSDWNPDNPALKAIKENAIILTRESLIGSGVKDYIAKPMQEILSRSVTLGMPYAEMIEGVRQILLAKDGRLVRYAKLYAMDSQFQFARNYIQTAAQNLKVKWWKYSGDTVRDSRQFCVTRHGNYYHTDEVKGWASLTWDGKNPNTTESNIFTLAGGYNCRHKIIPVLAADVPESRRKEVAENAK